MQARYSMLRSRSAAARRKAYYILDTGSSLAAAKEIRVLGTLPWWRERGDAGLRFLPAPAVARAPPDPPGAVHGVQPGGAGRDRGRAGHAARHRRPRCRPPRCLPCGGLSVLGLSLALQAILIALRFGVYFPEADDQTQDGMRAHDSMLEIERAAAPRPPGRLRPGGRPAGQAPVSGIAFEKVSFAYPGSGRTVLRELDLEFPAGTSTAIVGLNGAGKTTLVKLLSRLYEPTGGRITRGRDRPGGDRGPVLAAAPGGDLPGLRPLRA